MPISLLDEMRAKWPQFFPSHLVGFHLEAELGDPVIDEVIGFLRTTGREANWNWCPKVPLGHPTLYQVQGERVWEQADIDKADYVQMHVTREIFNGKMLPPNGMPEVEFVTRKGQLVGNMQNRLNSLCFVEFRAELEKQEFKGLTFRPVSIKCRKPEKLVLWQIWSAVTLPPVLDSLVGADGEPFDPATSKACAVNDVYRPMLHRFSTAKVRALEPFDIAVTKERWGGGFPHYREPAIIVSRRFREWFMKQKVPVEWWPVALE